MSEPIWNPCVRSRTRHPGRPDRDPGRECRSRLASRARSIVIPGLIPDDGPPRQAAERRDSSRFVAHPSIAMPASPHFHPQGHLGPVEPAESDEQEQAPEAVPAASGRATRPDVLQGARAKPRKTRPRKGGLSDALPDSSGTARLEDWRPRPAWAGSWPGAIPGQPWRRGFRWLSSQA